MKFARLGKFGSECPVVIDGGRVFDIRSLTADIDGRFLSQDPMERVRAALRSGNLPEVEAADQQRIGAPIARPSAVLCIGMNYEAHARESGAEPPTEPVLFMKPANTVVGPNDTVMIPRNSVKTDWEVELGVVIGKTVSYLDAPDQAISHIAGFVVANDLSERTFQLESPGGQWSKGKSAPGFTPLGPWLVTPDEIDHRDLRLRSRVNGEPRQDSTTADLIFSVEYVIWHLSQYLTLEPGDVVLTGTPEGVALSGRYPYLRPGDVVEVEIDNLGCGRQEFIAWSH